MSCNTVHVMDGFWRQTNLLSGLWFVKDERMRTVHSMNGAGRRSKVFSCKWTVVDEIFFVLEMDGRTDELSPYVEACVLRFMSVRVHVRVRVRTLVRSADFVRVRVRIRVRSLGKSRVRVRIRVRSLKKFRVRVRVCFGHGLGHKLMSELLSVSAQLWRSRDVSFFEPFRSFDRSDL